MKLTPLASALGAALLTALIGNIAPLHADASRVKDDGPKVVLPPRRAAPAVDATQRATKLNAALKAIGASVLAPGSLDMRVTPANPRHASGAEILSAGPAYVWGPDNGEPQGSYHLLTRKSGSITAIRMKFPTEKNRHYAVDCSVNPPAGPALKYIIAKPGVGDDVPVDNGHLYTGFLANGTQSEITLMIFPAAGSTSDDLGYFYGCEVGKA